VNFSFTRKTMARIGSIKVRARQGSQRISKMAPVTAKW
jgi:hypothetical protein